MTGPDSEGGRFHLYYGNSDINLNETLYASLDRDDTDSYGPEIVTIWHLSPDDVYRYSVHDYSNRGSSFSQALGQSNARVKVYNSENELMNTFDVPYQAGTLWTVFEIDQLGVITPINSMSYESSSEIGMEVNTLGTRDSNTPINDSYEIVTQVKK